MAKLPAPLITPEIVSLPVSPVVSVTPLESSTFPAPLREFIVSVLSTSYIAPELTDTSVVSAKIPVVCRVPSLIDVSPE